MELTDKKTTLRYEGRDKLIERQSRASHNRVQNSDADRKRREDGRYSE